MYYLQISTELQDIIYIQYNIQYNSEEQVEDQFIKLVFVPRLI